MLVLTGRLVAQPPRCEALFGNSAVSETLPRVCSSLSSCSASPRGSTPTTPNVLSHALEHTLRSPCCALCAVCRVLCTACYVFCAVCEPFVCCTRHISRYNAHSTGTVPSRFSCCTKHRRQLICTAARSTRRKFTQHTGRHCAHWQTLTAILMRAL